MQVRIEHGDALATPSDVLVLKFAQALMGVDNVAWRRAAPGRDPHDLPAPGGALRIPGGPHIAARELLFIGVPPLGELKYRDLRDLGHRSLAELQRQVPGARRVLHLLHGTGFGLDETEAFSSLLAGLREAVAAGQAPPALEEVVVVNSDLRRVDRLRDVLHTAAPLTATRRSPAAPQADDKRRVFVAMPFAGEFDDVFHYGIQGAVNAAGLLAERADAAHFTGDVMHWVQQRIAGAALVVADLSGANPNVYLEVGYALGCGVPVVLLLRNGQEARFDLRNHRMLIYSSIKNLESQLAVELRALLPAACAAVPAAPSPAPRRG